MSIRMCSARVFCQRALLCLASVLLIATTVFFPAQKVLVNIPYEWNDEDLNYTTYLPATLSLWMRASARNRRPDSLSMMLPPDTYREMTCPTLRAQHTRELAAVEKLHAKKEYPDWKDYPKGRENFMDPYPLCGRYLLDALSPRTPQRLLFAVRAAPSLAVRAGEWSETDVRIEQCGRCLEKPGAACDADVLFAARLLSEDRVVNAFVSPPAADGSRAVRFLVPDAGHYTLEVKMAQVDGFSEDPVVPKTLGLVGLKSTGTPFEYFKLTVCDAHRHVYGSPMRLRVVRSAAGESSGRGPTHPLPLCNASSALSSGQWVRYTSSTDCADSTGRSHCSGDAVSLSDPGGYNVNLVWAPTDCRLRVFAYGSGGPAKQCLRTPPPTGRRAARIVFAGDSLTEEHFVNCVELSLHRGGSRLSCENAWNVISSKTSPPLDQMRHLSRGILDRVIMDGVNTAGVLVTNLGIHHVIGWAHPQLWTELVNLFVAEWKRRNVKVLRGPHATAGNFTDCVQQRIAHPETHCVEWAVWISPPHLQYGYAGMTQQREQLFDRIAYERLKEIGFTRLDLVTPTQSRVEGSCDGLHYFAFRQARWRLRVNEQLESKKWTGGVSLMLFFMLLHTICFS